MKLTMTALAALLCAAPALAQTNVTVYGIVDAGAVSERGGPEGNVTKISSGVASGSRLGFRGKEDLGNGMAVVFALENGFLGDTGALGQGGLLFGRQAMVGLTSRAGSLTVGRQYTPYYRTLKDVADPFAAVSLAGRSGNIMTLNTRTDNMVQYGSPTNAGLRAEVAYAVGEVADDSSKNRTMGASIGYTRAALRVQGAYHRVDNATGTDAVRNTLLAASYKFKRLTAHLAHARNAGLAGADSRDTLAGMSVPVGAHTVMLSHIRHEDRTLLDRDARQWGLGYFYSLSKRTDLYAAYAIISNENNAGFTVGTATERGTGDRAANLGIRHTF
jgi:predicted porin